MRNTLIAVVACTLLGGTSLAMAANGTDGAAGVGNGSNLGSPNNHTTNGMDTGRASATENNTMGTTGNSNMGTGNSGGAATVGNGSNLGSSTNHSNGATNPSGQ